VCSDDYVSYLAYRLLEQDFVPAVIIGSYSGPVRSPGEPGGWELLPPVGMTFAPLDFRELINSSEVNRYIDYRLNELRRFEKHHNLLPRLIELRYRFGALLQRSELTEKEVHDFLVSNPELIDPTASQVLSEVRLGNAYRVDIALQYDVGPTQKTQLIEIEKPSHKLFTKSGRPRAYVTHAIQQVEDWIRWWRENPEKVPEPLRPELPPDGTVIIGRSVSLTDREKKALEHLNSNRIVKTITYDRLLERFDRMIKSIQKAAID